MSQFECKLSDLQEPKKEVKSAHDSKEKNVHFDEKVNLKENEKVNLKENEKVNEPIEHKSTSLTDVISNNKNTVFVIVVAYLLLNTDAVKGFVFKMLPQLMNSSTDYNLMGTLLSAFLLGISTVLFISYF